MAISLEKIQKKDITISVIGLGYVGLPLSLAFTEKNVTVIGIDIDQKKINTLQQGKSYLKHISAERIETSIKNETLQVTSDLSAVKECDAVIICVPTPLDKHMEPDLRFIRKTCEDIAPSIKEDTLVVLESTTWPGTTDEVIKKIIDKRVYLAFSPEREDPGNQKYSTDTIPKVVGGVDQNSLEIAIALYSLAVEKIVPVSSTRVAEATKLFENIFRSVNIALVNELKMICDPMGIDVWEVIQAASTKPFGFMPFWPGPGLGGHCIPIDPFYLSWKAKEYGMHTRFIELAGEINRNMPKFVVDKVQDTLNNYDKPVKGSKILILGLSYKPNIDDIRESPSLRLIDMLQQKGASVSYHDPHCPEIVQTRDYGQLAGEKSQPITDEYDCFVLSTQHSCFSVDHLLSHGVPIVDTRNLFPNHKLVTKA